MRAGRKDHTLLRDPQLHEGLLQNEEDLEEVRKERATVLRLLGLAKKEVWVRFLYPQGVSVSKLNLHCLLSNLKYI